jgi:phosphatidylserine/phosphatidylglycerophosphate/cardiolipin synthase-like enzyme
MVMSKVFFVLLLLCTQAESSSLFKTQDCHPKITSSCPLDSYSQNASRIDRWKKNFVITFQGLKDYYQHVSDGLIFENPENFELVDSHQRPLQNQSRKHLTFKVDYDKKVVTSLNNLSPESAEKLFRFNASLFNQLMGEQNFIKSKTKYYNETRFNRFLLRFDRDILLLKDWTSLIHPPIFNLNEIQQEKVEEHSPFRTKDYQLEMDGLTQTELTSGNDLKLFVNNASYAEKIRLIKNANKFVFLAVMSFAPTTESDRIIEALIERAQAGLDVRVIMEKVWTLVAFKKTVTKLKAGGVKVILSDDLIRFGRNQSLFHSKYIVVDGVVGIIGGQNLVDRSHKASGYNHFNKDTDVRVNGPVLVDLIEDYIKLWQRFAREDFPLIYKKYVIEQKAAQRVAQLRGSENYSQWMQGESSKGLCRFISQGAHSDKFKISRAYKATFEKMQKQLYFTSQHISFKPKDISVWSSRIYSTLFEKAKSGVPVTLITNGIDGGFLKSEGANPFAAFFTSRMNNITGYLNTAIRRNKLEYVSKIDNFEVWQHFQYIHSKVAVVDSEVAAIGSYNFETYSAEHSYETAIFCQDQGLVKTLTDDLILTMANSTPLVLDSNSHKEN